MIHQACGKDAAVTQGRLLGPKVAAVSAEPSLVSDVPNMRYW